MNEKEIENLIKNAMKIDEKPEIYSFSKVLDEIEINSVTNKNNNRYYIKTEMSKITINKFTKIIDVWKSKRLIFVPAFVFLMFVGAFSLSFVKLNSNEKIIKLAEQNAIEETYKNEEDYMPIALFETPAINELGTITNEI